MKERNAKKQNNGGDHDALPMSPHLAVDLDTKFVTILDTKLVSILSEVRIIIIIYHCNSDCYKYYNRHRRSNFQAH